MAIGDISLEPLLNQSTSGLGINKKLTFTPVNEVGETSNRAAVTVSDVAQQITIGTNKRTMEIMNNGANDIYYGGSAVASTTGVILYPGQVKSFSNVKDDFNVYVVCAAGLTANMRIVEYA